MALSEDFLISEDSHPIDLAETLAEAHEWDFDRVTEDQLSLVLEGQWRTYSITLAWSERDEVLRLISTFEMDPPADRLPALYDMLNRANDQCWTGCFSYWADQKLMVWRYGLLLSGGQSASADQIDGLIRAAVVNSERFYPAFQLGCWGETTPARAIQVAIAEAYGRA